MTRPVPSCRSAGMLPIASPPNDTAITSALAVISPPVRSSPAATASALSAPASHASRIRETRKTS